MKASKDTKVDWLNSDMENHWLQHMEVNSNRNMNYYSNSDSKFPM